jgi:hypothetical protein
MVENGREWIAHQGTRAHKRMASKAMRKPQDTEGCGFTKKNKTITELL